MASLQFRRYLRDRRSGVSREDAASAHGIGNEEAHLHDVAEAAGEYAGIDLSEPAPIGHNSGETKMTDVNGDPLRLLIERVERLEEEKRGMAEDIRDVYAEAKSQGYDPKIMRECVRLRRMEKNARDERAALIETYGAQLGLF